MSISPSNDPITARFKALLLEIADQRNPATVPSVIVDRLNALPEVALARLWLLRPGDICEECRLREECEDQSQCLHLVASAGSPTDPAEDWNQITGGFRRFPLGARKVGRVALTQEPIEIRDLREGSEWINKEWSDREGVRGFVGHPITYNGALLGVLGVFLRVSVVEESCFWFRMIADHAAAAIVNARAFEEIEALRERLEMENEYLREEVRTAAFQGELIGRSPSLRRTLEQIEMVAPTDTSVMILGESGVGKELVARRIHERSRRSARPIVKVNCASIPHDLFESEFFGHVRGAFTGAVRDRVGRFELASGGTLFLDEVGEIPLDMQSKLLRVLQEGTFERIGEERTRKADVRIIAATNRDLESDVAGRKFRQDLYYRLSVFPIEVAPLRDRSEDIPDLVVSFLESQSRRAGIPVPRLKKRHVARLMAYGWPGNVRELQNVVERAVIRARSGPLEFDLPSDSSLSSGSISVERRKPVQAFVAGHESEPRSESELLTHAEVRDLERENLLAVLKKSGWKISGPGGAAEFMGLHPATLTSRMRAMGIKRPV